MAIDATHGLRTLKESFTPLAPERPRMAIVDIVNYLSYQLTMSTLSFIPEQSLGFMTITTNRLLNALLRRSMREAGIDLSGEQWGVLIIL